MHEPLPPVVLLTAPHRAVYFDENVERNPPRHAQTQQLTRFAFFSHSGAAISIGGPLLTMRLTPTEDELRSRYNPDLLKKSIEGRQEREEEFDEFVTRLKQYSKSDKPS